MIFQVILDNRKQTWKQERPRTEWERGLGLRDRETVEPSLEGHSRDKEKCPLNGGVRWEEVGDNFLNN